HGLKAVDDLRGADQYARLLVLPHDFVEVRTGSLQHGGQIKILFADAQARQAGSEHLIECAVRIKTENWYVYAEDRDLFLFRPECAVCKQVQCRLGARAGNEVLPEVV